MALTKARKWTDRAGDSSLIPILKVPLKAGAKVWTGGIVALDAGYGIAGAAAVGKPALGIALQDVDNTTGSSGDLWVEVRRGTFTFNNSSAGDAIAQADFMKLVYIVDDETVAKTDNSGARSVAGRMVGLESGQVWVEMIGPVGDPNVGAAIASLTDNGGGTADGTVASQAAPVTLTDSTGLSGTHDDTLAATTVPADLTGGEAPTEAEHNALLAVVRVMAQNASDNAQKIIELVTLGGVAQNNLKELTAKLELILAALRTAKIIAP